MFEKYEERLNKILEAKPQRAARRSTKRRSKVRSTKRRSTKRRSTKRRSTKRRSTKRRSRFGDDGDDGDDGDKEDDNTPKPKARDSLPPPRPPPLTAPEPPPLPDEALAEAALAEAYEALAEAARAEAANEAPSPLTPPLPRRPKRLSTWELEPALAEAAAEAEAAEAYETPLPPLTPPLTPPPRPPSKWVPGKRGPAPPPTARAQKPQEPGNEMSKSAERAKKFEAGVQDGVLELLKHINDLGGKATFGQLFTDYENVSDSLVGFLISAKRKGLIDYDGGFGGMLQQGSRDKDVEIELTEKAKAMLQN
jgi:hypothetical protein